MKIIVMLMGLLMAAWGRDLVVFENEFNLFTADKPFSQVVVGNQELLKASVMEDAARPNRILRLFGKKSGSTSMLIRYNDNTIENYQVYVNQNLGFVQKMLNTVAPGVTLLRAGDGATVMGGHFSDPHQKKKVQELLSSAGIDANKTMDLSQTSKIEKMVRTKLYLVAIDNDRAEELGGAVGLNYFAKDGHIVLNQSAKTYATFSGFLLDQTGAFANTGKALLANLNFLQSKGVAKIMDDTVLLSTEDKNASFHVGGEVYIPVGMTYNSANFPTINLEEKEYGLRLTLKPKFLEKEEFMGITVAITDSDFDEDPRHQVQLGENVFVPAFRAKNISTDVVAKNGQVIALGGRLHTETLKREEKVPLLGDIPVLGHLFKRNIESARANDLLFFLVPEIIDPNEPHSDEGYYGRFVDEAAQVHRDQLRSAKPAAKEPQASTAPEPAADIREVAPAAVFFNADSEIVVQAVKETPEGSEALQEVTAPKIYVRSAPGNGKPAGVWENGHRFIAGKGEIESDGIVWTLISHDCAAECRLLEQPLWISKKYTRAL
ncbi:MAG: type II and III secretion system protein [Campylobacterales bacterium]|nr:type II and III secretion system protein [Campylobacterales bacterium]